MGLPLGKVVCWGLVLGALERQMPRARSQVALGQSAGEIHSGGAEEGEQAQGASSREAKRKARIDKGRMAISLLCWSVRALVSVIWCGERRVGGEEAVVRSFGRGRCEGRVGELVGVRCGLG